ncbi:MAG TPA: hypothetical protein IAD13_04395 [Bacteroidetes bacterium]|nr:hypothetical protein [Candidatus Limimorpha avicola]
MKIRTIVELLNGKVACGEERLDEEYDYAFASDLMSDILTLGDNNPVIMTGLCTVQTIRTCEMGNLDVIIFVRKKKPTPEMIELAKDNDMVLIECDYSMFKTSGILYSNGMLPVY